MNIRTLWLILATLCCQMPASTQADDSTDGTSVDEAYDCLIEPGRLADVGSASRGILAGLLVERGDRVVRGQPVARLESAVERTAQELAEARASMRSEVVSREADLRLASLDRARFDDLSARALTSGQLRDEAGAREQIASAALVQAREEARLREIEWQGAQQELARRTIDSPFDGVVVAELMTSGELVFDTPVMSIAALDPLHVELVLEARLFGTVHEGDMARLVPELGDGSSHEAVVTIIDAMIDPGSGTFGVRLVLANPELAIPAGQRCRVEFDGPTAGAIPAVDSERLR